MVINKLDEVCSEDPLDIKNTNNILIEIKPRDPNKEIKVNYKMTYIEQDVNEFKEETKVLLSKGLIRESYSPHSSPAFYVNNHNEQKRGKRRMVIDYRKINEATIGNAQNLPRKELLWPASPRARPTY